MAKVIVTREVNAPLNAIWDSWDDFGNIVRFNPNLKGSFLINDSKATGLGATRQCDLADGKNYIQERIVEYVPMQKLTVDIYNGTMPLKKAEATFRFTPTTDKKTKVTMTMDFQPKFGLFGKMMIPMMKPQFRKMLNALLAGNAEYLERGKEAKAVA
ncbi:MAG: SRPBCC family protein [Pseudomonadota bacterium]